MVSGLTNQGLLGGTLSNSSTSNITENVNGKLGKCYNFTGTGYLSTVNNMTATNEITWIAWVKPAYANGGFLMGIVNNFSHTGSTGYNASFCIEKTSKKLRLDIPNKNGNSHIGIAISAGIVPDGVWTHVAATFNYTTG